MTMTPERIADMREALDADSDLDSVTSRRTTFLALLDAAAQLAQLRAILEWQPIETAPRGVSVLLCRVWDGQSSLMRVGWFDQGIWQDWSRNPMNPTHWMPLPKPPENQP